MLQYFENIYCSWANKIKNNCATENYRFPCQGNRSAARAYIYINISREDLWEYDRALHVAVLPLHQQKWKVQHLMVKILSYQFFRYDIIVDDVAAIYEVGKCIRSHCHIYVDVVLTDVWKSLKLIFHCFVNI